MAVLCPILRAKNIEFVSIDLFCRIVGVEGTQNAGFIAQELERLLPDIVQPLTPGADQALIGQDDLKGVRLHKCSFGPAGDQRQAGRPREIMPTSVETAVISLAFCTRKLGWLSLGSIITHVRDSTLIDIWCNTIDEIYTAKTI